MRSVGGLAHARNHPGHRCRRGLPPGACLRWTATPVSPVSTMQSTPDAHSWLRNWQIWKACSWRPRPTPGRRMRHRPASGAALALRTGLSCRRRGDQSGDVGRRTRQSDRSGVGWRARARRPALAAVRACFRRHPLPGLAAGADPGGRWSGGPAGSLSSVFAPGRRIGRRDFRLCGHVGQRPSRRGRAASLHHGGSLRFASRTASTGRRASGK